MIGEATLRHLAAQLGRLPVRILGAIATAGSSLGLGRAKSGCDDDLSPGRRQWLSVPLATAAAAGLMAVLLSVDVVGKVAPTSRPVTVDVFQKADPTPKTEAGTSQSLEPELALAAMPEPAAGPTGAAVFENAAADVGAAAPERATVRTSRLPVVPEVPPELDDIARELQRRRAEVLELEAGLALREAALRAAEADLSAQVDRLEAFQRQLEALVGEAEAEEEERLQQLVKMYESMRAKSAAAIFDRLEMPVILSVATRMREARMAAILAAMNPDRARIVTSEIARERELPRLN